MDLFFIIKKVYEENQVFHFKDLGTLSWKLTNILKVDKRKSEKLKGILFIVFIYLNCFLDVSLSVLASHIKCHPKMIHWF